MKKLIPYAGYDGGRQHEPRPALPMRPAMSRAVDHEAFWKDAGKVLTTGLKLKKIMLKKGITRCRCECPRCGGTIYAGLVGRKNHLRMACEGKCGMNMME